MHLLLHEAEFFLTLFVYFFNKLQKHKQSDIPNSRDFFFAIQKENGAIYSLRQLRQAEAEQGGGGAAAQKFITRRKLQLVMGCANGIQQ